MMNADNQILTDSLDRQITYLRLSVTDHCQFKCLYCVPPEGIPRLSASHYMTADEMERLVRAVAELGVTRVRLTGGEPLLRKDILSLVARLSSVAGITDLALTTNGERLAGMAGELKNLGLQRINISLDSLDEKRFEKLTLSPSGSFNKVWAGLNRALEVGLKIKINVVVMQGISDSEIDRFAALAFRLPLEIRFIELMPLCGTGWDSRLMLPMSYVKSRIEKNYALKPLVRGTEVAESHKLIGGAGGIGYIASMTEPFCSKCSRLRVSATGKIRLCLFSPLEYDLLKTLRHNTSLEDLQEELRRVVFKKPASHPFINVGSETVNTAVHGSMRAIGG